MHRGFWPAADAAEAAGSAAITVMSYNVLADRYVRPGQHPQSPPRCLDEAHRHARVAEEIAAVAPDVLSLQEVTRAAVMGTGALRAALHGLGYDMAFVPVSAGAAPAPAHEGVAVAWRRARFTAGHVEPLRFHDLLRADAALAPAHRELMLGIRSHNVAMSVVLRDAAAAGAAGRRRRDVLLTGLHAVWSPNELGFAQLWQQVALLRHLEGTARLHGGAALVLAGDFNAGAAHPSVSYLLTGSSAANVPEHAVGDTARARHGFPLATAYAAYTAAHPQAATFPAHGGFIDHVIYDRTAFACRRVLHVGRRATPCPSDDVPSDHFPVAAVLVPRDAGDRCPDAAVPGNGKRARSGSADLVVDAQGRIVID
jgi:endonuclease/exonuclease/phosphatase family metal-dependent hydrolase